MFKHWSCLLEEQEKKEIHVAVVFTKYFSWCNYIFKNTLSWVSCSNILLPSLHIFRKPNKFLMSNLVEKQAFLLQYFVKQFQIMWKKTNLWCQILLKKMRSSKVERSRKIWSNPEKKKKLALFYKRVQRRNFGLQSIFFFLIWLCNCSNLQGSAFLKHVASMLKKKTSSEIKSQCSRS